MRDDQACVPEEAEGAMSFFRNISDALRASRQPWPGGRGISSSVRQPDPPSLQRGTFVKYIYAPQGAANARLAFVTINGANEIARVATDAQLKVAQEPTPGSG